MENHKLEINSKFHDSIGKWCVEVWMKDEVHHGYWHDCCFHEKREIAEKDVMEKVKKHIDFIRELKKTVEKREEIFSY